MPKNQLTLPTNRAFVVQLHADALPEQGDFKGRAEHLNSGEAVHFNSAEELLAFIARTLSAQQLAEAVRVQENEG
jgi:hypothetical protein